MTELPSTEASKRSILDKMSKHYGIMPDVLHKTLVKTIFPSEKEATPEQVAAFLMVCDRTGLDPFQREIYAFPARGGGIVPVIGADGYYRALTNDEDITGVAVDYGYKDDNLVSCTARIHKGDTTPYVEITEFLSENKRNTPNWNQMPHRMLRHRALMQATRIACGLHGVYDREEAVAVPGVETGPVETEAVVVETPTIDLSKAKDASKEEKRAAEWTKPGPDDLDTAAAVKEMFSDED
tara:strand:- start:668 stop:1384 length:717 start_codon:yes stop_codon:yes gene_type:complete